MTQRTIRQEVEAVLIPWAASKSIPIAHEGVAFTKPSSNWIEFYILPATTVNHTVTTTRKTLYGLLHFNIYTLNGKGTKKAEELAAELINLYPVLPKTGTVSIESTGSIMNSSTDAQWRVTPVRFRYRQENY